MTTCRRRRRGWSMVEVWIESMYAAPWMEGLLNETVYTGTLAGCILDDLREGVGSIPKRVH